MTIEDRKYALERAIEVCREKPAEIVATAASFMQFLEGKTLAALPTTMKNRIEHKLGELTIMQKVILQKSIELYHKNIDVSGAELGRQLKVSQSNCSLHLKHLIQKGYVLRKGNRFTPIFAPSGHAVPSNIRQLPPAPAQGYKGNGMMKLGDNTTLRAMAGREMHR